jgi:hypothetical protein
MNSEAELHQEWMDYLVTSREQLDFYEWGFKKLLAAPRPLEAGTLPDGICGNRVDPPAMFCFREKGHPKPCHYKPLDSLHPTPLSQPLTAPDVTKLAELSAKWRTHAENAVFTANNCAEESAEYRYRGKADGWRQAADELDAVREALQKLPGR